MSWAHLWFHYGYHVTIYLYSRKVYASKRRSKDELVLVYGLFQHFIFKDGGVLIIEFLQGLFYFLRDKLTRVDSLWMR